MTHVFLEWLWHSSIALAVLVPLAWLLSRLLYHAAGARAAYLAWLLPLAALVPTGVLGGVMPATAGFTLVADGVPVGGGAALEGSAVGGWLWALAAVWAMGAVIAAVWFGRTQLRFQAVLRAGACNRTEVANEIQAHGFPRLVRVRFSHACRSPMLVGALRPTLWLPADLDERDSAQTALVLAHEQAHVRHGDPWWLLLALWLRCLFWFHPAVQLGWYRFRADQELAADAAALADLGKPDRLVYAQTLCRTAGLDVHALGFGGLLPSLLKERVMMIVEKKRRPLPFHGALMIVSGLFLASGWVIASVSDEPREVDYLEPVEVAEPEWPRQALVEGTTGHVTMEVVINEDGYVSDVEVLDSEPGETFDRSAYRAIRQWQFPEQDQPVVTQQTIEFRQDES